MLYNLFATNDDSVDSNYVRSVNITLTGNVSTLLEPTGGIAFDDVAVNGYHVSSINIALTGNVALYLRLCLLLKGCAYGHVLRDSGDGVGALIGNIGNNIGAVNKESLELITLIRSDNENYILASVDGSGSNRVLGYCTSTLNLNLATLTCAYRNGETLVTSNIVALCKCLTNNGSQHDADRK